MFNGKLPFFVYTKVENKDEPYIFCYDSIYICSVYSFRSFQIATINISLWT
jgi:hypothetical protein